MSNLKESLSPLFYISFNEKMKIVIDAGAHSFKIGFAGDDLPRSVFPPIGRLHKIIFTVDFTALRWVLFFRTNPVYFMQLE